MIVLPFFSFLAFLIVVKGTSPTVPCNFQQCAPQPPIDLSDMGNNILPDEAFLDKYCSSIKSALSCVQNTLEACESILEEDEEEIQEFVSAAIEIMDELCDVNSELRQEYLSSISCINDNVEKYKQCALNTYQGVTRFASYLNEQGHDEDEIFAVQKCLTGISYGNKLLVTVTMMFSCVIYETRKNCNEEISEAVAEAGIEILKSIDEEVCPSEIMEKYLGEMLTFINENREYFDSFKKTMFALK